MGKKGFAMPPSMQEVYDSAIQLPLDIQAMLAEKLVNNVETHIDPEITRLHCAIAKKRRAEVLSGEVQPVEGNEALLRVRKAVGI